MIAYINDNFVEMEKVSLKLTDLSIQRGYAVFDFLRTKNSKPLFFDDYLDRFFRSADSMRLELSHTRQELKVIVREIIRQNDMAESGIKLLLTGGFSEDGYTPAQPNLVITQHEVQLTTPEKFANGIRVITYPYQRELPMVKSTNYLMGVWLQQELKTRQAADVLYHSGGVITEFPRSNVFVVTASGSLVTPADNVLPGITRQKVLQLAEKKFRTETRPVLLDDIKNAKEIFMTSTTKRLLPVVSVDDDVIGDGKAGPVTRQLSEDFLALEDEYLSDFNW